MSTASPVDHAGTQLSITETASIGARLHASEAVRASVDTIVDEVREASAKITDVRGPREGAATVAGEAFEDLLQRAGDARGRGLIYPYLGSGLGNGALVELLDGSVKWDMVGGIGVHFLGHSHPAIVRASVEAGVDAVAKHGNLQSGWAAHEFNERLVRLAGRRSNLKHGFVTTSGAMANENALKVCYQKHAPAGRVLAFKHCFMGRSITMCQIGDSAGGRAGIPLTTQVDYLPFWNEQAAELVGGATKFIDHTLWRLDQFVERYPGQYACMIFELVQGEGGFNVAPRDFHKALMERCKDHSIAVWDDEIQTFGRTGQMFAFEQYDLGEYVDVFCVGKMTQACATLYTEEYNPKPGLLSGTFLGSTQDFMAGSAVLRVLEESDLYDSTPTHERGDGDGLVSRHHAAFREQAEAMRARHPGWFPDVPFIEDTIGGLGGMMRFTPFGGDKAKIVASTKALFDAGVVSFYCGHGPFHLRFLPPLGVMKLEDWPRVFERVEAGLSQVN